MVPQIRSAAIRAIARPGPLADFRHAQFLHACSLAETAIISGNFDLMEDAAGALFRQDPRLDRYRQRNRSREWLAGLSGEPASTTLLDSVIYSGMFS
jgi:hypothetical protein